MEYDNLVMASMRGRAGQIMGGGFSGGKAQLGVRTTKAVKKIGCSNLKQLLESDKIIVEDFDCINELSTFIVKGHHLKQMMGVMMTWLRVCLYSVEQTRHTSKNLQTTM